MDLCLGAVLSSSRYNFAIPVESGFVLYNSASGAVLGLSGRGAERLAMELGGNPRPVRLNEIDDILVKQLKAGGFLIDARADEVAAVRERFHDAVAGTPVVLTVTTTMDCNLSRHVCSGLADFDELTFPKAHRRIEGRLAACLTRARRRSREKC